MSDRLPQISGGDAGTRVHTHGKTHTETEAGEEDRGWGGHQRMAERSQRKYFPEKAEALSSPRCAALRGRTAEGRCTSTAMDPLIYPSIEFVLIGKPR